MTVGPFCSRAPAALKAYVPTGAFKQDTLAYCILMQVPLHPGLFPRKPAGDEGEPHGDAHASHACGDPSRRPRCWVPHYKG